MRTSSKSQRRWLSSSSHQSSLSLLQFQAEMSLRPLRSSNSSLDKRSRAQRECSRMRRLRRGNSKESSSHQLSSLQERALLHLLISTMRSIQPSLHQRLELTILLSSIHPSSRFSIQRPLKRLHHQSHLITLMIRNILRFLLNQSISQSQSATSSPTTEDMDSRLCTIHRCSCQDLSG